MRARFLGPKILQPIKRSAGAASFWGLALSAWCALPAQADDWPQWLGRGRDGVWRETGIIRTFPTNGPPVRWRVAIRAGYSGPAVGPSPRFVEGRQTPPQNAQAR